jgi:hypothetical protein
LDAKWDESYCWIEPVALQFGHIAFTNLTFIMFSPPTQYWLGAQRAEVAYNDH